LRPSVGEPEVIEWIKDELSYLPEAILTNVLKVAGQFPEAAVCNTLENVEVTKILVKDLLEPLFKKGVLNIIYKKNSIT